jgi:hypothetical protein
MIYAVAALAIAVFMFAFMALGIVPVARAAINTSRAASRALADPALDDDGREQALRQASLSLLGNFASITLRGALALALSGLSMLAADAAGVAPIGEVITLLSSWQAIVVTTIVLTAAWLIWNRR